MKSTKNHIHNEKDAGAEDMIKRAMEQPVVVDLMEVYESWKKYEEPTKARDLLRAAHQHTSLSVSSVSLLREII